jgi:hypothetical protein
VFFSEEKKKKTLDTWREASRQRAQMIKSFWFFFSKNILSVSTPAQETVLISGNFTTSGCGQPRHAQYPMTFAPKLFSIGLGKRLAY